MNTHDRIIGIMVREIAKLQARQHICKNDKEATLIINSKMAAYKKAIELIREDELEWN